MWKRKRTYFFILISLLFSFVDNSHKEIEEYNAKALFIYNFTKYIDWENVEQISEFKISVYKSSPILSPLKHISLNKKVFNKKLIVSEVRGFPEFPDFQILFIPEKTPLEACDFIKNNTHYKNILIISENNKHFKEISCINFLMEQNKIKFEVNLSQAEKANLKISSQLLKLAVYIKK
ncbi:MAG: YfiR family protein [Flavobacteriia bacterium]|nr:YfiR family protein [Flavobacteriia bacterium]